MPKNLDYCSIVLAFTMESFLFSMHIQDRDLIDTKVHILLIYSIVITIISLVCEMVSPHNPIPAIVKSWFLLVQGTWFLQICPILYADKPWEGNHHNMLLIPIIFTWHIAGNLAMIILTALTTYFRVKRAQVISYELVNNQDD